MSPSAESWLREFEKSLRGEYNSCPTRIPDDLRDAMFAALMADREMREIDRRVEENARRLTRSVARLL